MPSAGKTAGKQKSVVCSVCCTAPCWRRNPRPWPRVSALFLRRASLSSHSALNTRTRGMQYYLVRLIVRKIVTSIIKLH